MVFFIKRYREIFSGDLGKIVHVYAQEYEIQVNVILVISTVYFR